MTIDIYNDTNAPEQLHWDGPKIPARRRRTVQVRMNKAYAVARHKVLSQIKMLIDKEYSNE